MMPLLKMDRLSKEMKQLKKKVYRQHLKEIIQQKKHWLDFIKVRDIPGECPHRIAFEKILQKDENIEDEVMMFNFCKHTIFAAAKRQMKAAPKPDPKIADDFIRFSKSILNSTCQPHLRNPELTEQIRNFKYSFQQWFEHNPAKKQKDIEDYLRYVKEGASDFTQKQIDLLTTTDYTGICKQELQPKNGKPRMVCAIPIKTKVTMGPVTWKLEEIMAKYFPGYCGNKNLQEMTDSINKILAEGFTKIVEGDGSAFDNTQDVSLKEVDRYLYSMIEDKIHHVPKQQFHQISQALYKIMRVEYVQGKKKKVMFRYKILGSVFSGDCDTTLCNTMRMALYNLYINEKSGLKYGVDYKLFSKGDDFTIFYKPYVDNEFIKNSYYKYFVKAQENDIAPVYGLGQVLKFITIGNPNTISFCSLRALYMSEAEDKIILVRDFTKFLNIAKYSRKIKVLTGKERIHYLLEQAVALRTSYPGIHIFENMAAAYEQEARQYSFIMANYDKMKAKILLQKAQNLTIQIFSKARKAMTQYVSENKTDELLYDIGYKRKTFKIQDNTNYWEMIKLLQNKCSYKLSTEELRYINQQLEAEISSEIFKATMGLKIERDEEW